MKWKAILRCLFSGMAFQILFYLLIVEYSIISSTLSGVNNFVLHFLLLRSFVNHRRGDQTLYLLHLSLFLNLEHTQKIM